MQSSNHPPKSAKGTVGIESFQGRLRLHLPRAWYGGRNKYLSLGLDDTPENRVLAETKATQIAVDYKLGQFDPTLDRYRPRTHLIPVATQESVVQMTLSELWGKYVDFKTPTVSPSTARSVFQPVTRKLAKVPKNLSLDDGVAIRDWLLKTTSPDSSRRILMHLNAAMKWAKKSGLIEFNSFDGLYNQIKLSKSQQSGEFEVHPFTRDERDAIIAAFENDQFVPKSTRRDAVHSNYAPYVKFLFYTGCRPSEVIGLRWKHIKDDRILLQQSIVTGTNGRLEKTGLKTQDFRYFPINSQLRAILESIKPENANPEDLVFPAPKGGYINTQNFAIRVWPKVLEGLGIPYRRPYQTRHTFITLCLENGIDAKDVAKWVGNSPEIIYKHYAGAKTELDVPEL